MGHKSHDRRVEVLAVRLEWEGKPRRVTRLSLPFQTVETINTSRATRERDTGSLFQADAGGRAELNQLIWGDNKLVASSLLNDYAGKVDLVYIDPPFDTGTDFSFRVQVGDSDITKEPSVLEESAYRDTWARGRSSYLEMLYERILLIHELLAQRGSLFLHLGSNVSHYRSSADDGHTDTLNSGCEQGFCVFGGTSPCVYSRAPGGRLGVDRGFAALGATRAGRWGLRAG